MASDQYWLSGAHWRRSNYSTNGGECLEVAEGFKGAAHWRKSSHSNGSGGNCLEVADHLAGVVPVRDSKVPDGPVVTVSARAWAPFVAAVRAGRR
ncbi:DUF397 domain-containing protein [Streptomyces sp. CC228A]|uniref:DUF397 domain-containing protein n=1 Tax=Streptomyces sp. CC228A TaxID=2898186 RepID=UPI001F30B5AC|nr:DUF397 domain-containing protein [Streptomyces sp. CC228A]